MNINEKTTAFSPASVGNVAVGYDLLGHALEGPGDRVTTRRIEQPEVHITEITGIDAKLPLDANTNTAGRAVTSLLDALEWPFGIELSIDKGIPLGSGLGGSAASATAALTAANALLDEPLTPEALYPHALEGEFAASGGYHGDNVGPQLLGGLVLATRDRLIRVPVPRGLTAVVVHPHLVVETRRARQALEDAYDLDIFIIQNSNLSLVLSGCYKNDVSLIRAGLGDVLIEPRRAGLIPGFDRVKQAALDHGALGSSISGAGPSVFAWFEDERRAALAGQAMAGAFATVNLMADIYVSPVDAPGARLIAPPHDGKAIRGRPGGGPDIFRTPL